jgi:hypothetical protein
MSNRPALLLFCALCAAVVHPPSAFADSLPRYLRLTADNVTNTFNLIELTGGVTLTNLGNGTARLVITGTSGGITNNWTGGAITLDAANSKTNTFGGYLVIGGGRYQANGGFATGTGSWAMNGGIAEGIGSWANNYASATGYKSWANAGAVAGGTGSWAMGALAYATNDETFVWSDGTAIGSTTNKQFSAYASNGFRLLGGPITGDGSLITNVNAATLGGVALGGLVQTQEVTNASNTLAQATAGKAATNAALTGFSSGSATTGQVATANGSGGTFWATPAAGGATTPWTNSVMFRTGSFRNATTNDFLGGIITGNETLDTASGASVALFNTVANAATNIYSGSAWFVFPWPAGNDMTTLQLGFRKSGTTATNFPLTLMYSNRLTQATASMVLTGAAPLADTTYWTNMSITSSICTQAVQGSEWVLRWDASFGASVSTTQGYMGIAIQGTLFK